VRGALLDEGWRVATIWECALRKPEQVSVATDRLSEWLLTVGATLELGENEVSKPTREGEDVGSSR
jgi:DNA mismatch endonuclease (patch repair protein)